MRQKDKTKLLHVKRYQDKHTALRLRQRYGIHVSEAEINYLVHMIINGNSIKIATLSQRLSQHYLVYNRIATVVLYDRLRKSIATAMIPSKEHMAKVHAALERTCEWVKDTYIHTQTQTK